MRDQEYNLKPSNYYVAAITLATLSSMLVWISQPLSFAMLILGELALMGYSGYLLKRYVLLAHSQSIKSLRLQEHHTWCLKLKDKKVLAELRGDSTITTYLAILRFRLISNKKPQTLSCIVWRDSLPQGYYRQLLTVIRMN